MKIAEEIGKDMREQVMGVKGLGSLIDLPVLVQKGVNIYKHQQMMRKWKKW